MKKIKWTLTVSSMFLAFSFLVLSINSPYSTVNAISLNNTTSRVLETEYSAPDSDEISKESLENQKEINGLIVNYESESVQSKLSFSDGTSESLFPESYAGAYYDYDKDKLIMCLTDNNDFDYFQEYFKSDLVDYKYVKYSYNYLLSIIHSMTEEVFNKYQLNYSADDMFNNCVKVSIPDKSIIHDFDEFLSQNGFDTNAVRYVIEEKTGNVLTSYNQSGRKILAKGQTVKAGTIGFNATRSYNGKIYKGVVTCNHVIDAYKTSIWQSVHQTNSTNVTRTDLLDPTAAATKKVTNSLVDAAFVPFLDTTAYNTPYIWNYEPQTQNIYQSKIVAYATTYSSYQGQVMTKYGAASGIETSMVEEISWSGNIDGIQRSDFFKLGAYSYAGDSGGPVGVEYTLNGNKCFSIYGITVARELVPNHPEYQGGPALCCKTYNILGALGVSVVTGPGYPY